MEKFVTELCTAIRTEVVNDPPKIVEWQSRAIAVKVIDTMFFNKVITKDQYVECTEVLSKLYKS